MIKIFRLKTIGPNILLKFILSRVFFASAHHAVRTLGNRSSFFQFGCFVCIVEIYYDIFVEAELRCFYISESPLEIREEKVWVLQVCLFCDSCSASQGANTILYGFVVIFQWGNWFVYWCILRYFKVRSLSFPLTIAFMFKL